VKRGCEFGDEGKVIGVYGGGWNGLNGRYIKEPAQNAGMMDDPG
jgi:hypothetical protein